MNFAVINTKVALASFSFALFFFALLFSFFFLQNANGVTEDKITIYPELNITEDFLSCLTEAGAFQVNISQPVSGTSFLVDTEIMYEGNVSFSCFENVPESIAQQYSYKWFLDSSTEPISNEKTSIISISEPREHVLTFEAMLELEGIDPFVGKSSVSFSVVKPEVQGAKTTAPTTRTTTRTTTVPPKPNEPPTAYIATPKEGEVFYSTYDAKSGKYYATIRGSGGGSDPEDGTLGPAALSWYYKSPTSSKIYVANGNTFTAILDAPSYSIPYAIFLKVTDSKGATYETSVNIIIYTYELG